MTWYEIIAVCIAACFLIASALRATFILIGVDAYFTRDKIATGIFICMLKNPSTGLFRSLFCIYFHNGRLIIDVLWIHILNRVYKWR